MINSKRGALYCFWLVTAVYLIISFITFNGFNGSDDLHYALLASNVIKGTYTPFAAADIFSGRVLLIWWQALIYYTGGINAFTTQAGTTLTIIISCYLTLFKLGKYSNWQPVMAGAALFYFNPVLKEAGTGVLPDVYIMLAGILIILLWNQIAAGAKHRLLKGALCGLIAFAALFFKENAILFAPFLLFISLWIEQKRTLLPALTGVAVFTAGVLLSGLVYYHYTGNFFFRVLQINNADYPNPCNYSGVPVGFLIKRLTYGVWQQFIVESFYPVILAAILLLAGIVLPKRFKIAAGNTPKMFIVLVLLGLYFPFSLKGYQPLCFMARHFIFLLAPAVILCISFLESAGANKNIRWLFVIASAIILLVCVQSTTLKWYWLMYGLLLAYFTATSFFTTGLPAIFKYPALAALLCCYLFYRLVFPTGNWYHDLKDIVKETNSPVYYFPDHDNMMHSRLLHAFKEDTHSYNLEQYPFKVFEPYYEKPSALNFKSGWLIVNRGYTVLPASFFTVTDSLKTAGYFSRHISKGVVDAYSVESAGQLAYIKTLVENRGFINK